MDRVLRAVGEKEGFEVEEQISRFLLEMPDTETTGVTGQSRVATGVEGAVGWEGRRKGPVRILVRS